MALVTSTDAINSAQIILQAVQNEAVIAQLITEGDRRATGLNTFNKQNIIRTQLVKHAWQRIGRQVLAMHPGVVDEVKVASSDKIPGDVLRVLPYMNPLVIYAEPPVFKSWLGPGEKHQLTQRTESAMRLLGFFTYGTSNVSIREPDGRFRTEQRVYPTNAPEADRFGMMLILEALDGTGKVIDLEFNSMTLRFGQTLTLSETVEDLMSRYQWDTPQHESDGKHETRHRKWMRDVLSVVVGSLFYLCSTTLEAEQVPPRSVAKRVNKKIIRKPFSLYQVGWTTGSALTRYRQSRKSNWSESEQGDIAHQQDPQHRRSHFKLQPCGPGRKDRKLIFVSAYWTHVERLGEVGVNTARTVPMPNGKGSVRESTRTAMDVNPLALEDKRMNEAQR